MIVTVCLFQSQVWGLRVPSKLSTRLLRLRSTLFPPAILVFPARAPGSVEQYQFLIPRGIRPFEITTHNQFHILALHVRVVLLVPRRELVESSAPQDLVQLVLRVRMAVRKLEEGR